MADDSIVLLLDEVRSKTIRLLESIPIADARWAPPGLQNTIVWHAGHCYFLLEWLTMHALERKPQIPRGWDRLFSWDSHPDQVDQDRWPSLAEIIHQLQNQHERMRQMFANLTVSQLSGPSADNMGRSVRYAIVHALHDEACHCGEIYLLKKMQAASRAQG
jgi:hypothetical protein